MRSRFQAFVKEFRIPTKKELSYSITRLSHKEAIFFGVLAMALFCLMIILVSKVNDYFLVTVPAQGGTLTEGIIGTPRFINPVLAFSDADKDLSSLVYSGLMRQLPSGEFVPDLAQSYSVSPNGLQYTFTLRKNAVFQDGTPVTADDVVYTIQKIQDPLIKSPLETAWQGVTVSKQDAQTVVFTLQQPFAFFINNATVGILPSHIWNKVTTEQFSFSNYNTDPIGSGPYKIRLINTQSGIPIAYSLVSFDRFALGKPLISTLRFVLYNNDTDLINAFKDGTVDAIHGISSDEAMELKSEGFSLYTEVLPRLFSLFVNPNKNPIFTDHTVVTALNDVIDKNQIVQNVLHGYGQVINGPVPTSDLGGITTTISSTSTNEDAIATAKAMLDKDGWLVGPDGLRHKKEKTGTETLTFSIATGDIPELKDAVALIIQDANEIGIQATEEIYDSGSLNQNVIRPRDYDALFFGQIVSNESDLYAFWDSSQKDDPGLNIALYANPQVDTLLQTANQTLDPVKRQNLYLEFNTQVMNDMPAIFIYAPDFIYAVRPHIYNFNLGTIVNPADRFNAVYTWYLETDRVWKIFSHSIFVPHINQQ